MKFPKNSSTLQHIIITFKSCMIIDFTLSDVPYNIIENGLLDTKVNETVIAITSSAKSFILSTLHLVRFFDWLPSR